MNFFMLSSGRCQEAQAPQGMGGARLGQPVWGRRRPGGCLPGQSLKGHWVCGPPSEFSMLGGPPASSPGSLPGLGADWSARRPLSTGCCPHAPEPSLLDPRPWKQVLGCSPHLRPRPPQSQGRGTGAPPRLAVPPTPARGPSPGRGPVWKAQKEKWSLEFFPLKKTFKRKLVSNGERLMGSSLPHTWARASEVVGRNPPPIRCNRTRGRLQITGGPSDSPAQASFPPAAGQNTQASHPRARAWGPGPGAGACGRWAPRVSGGVPDEGGGWGSQPAAGPAGAQGQDGDRAAMAGRPALASRPRLPLVGGPRRPKRSMNSPPTSES